jgi:hypothetical protein
VEFEAMNWRRGLFRLWLVGSIVWTGLASWHVYDRTLTARERASRQAACVDERRRKPELGNPFDCFDGGMEFGDLVTAISVARELAVMTVPPIVGSFLMGLAFFWIVTGFRAQKQQSD